MIVRSKRRVSLAVLLFPVFGLVVGCSQSGDELPREAVSGTVTLDGTPVSNGTITFIPDTGVGGGGGTITDGAFSIPRATGLVPGKFKVAINASEKTATTKPQQVSGTKKEVQFAKELIPTKYNSNTELTAEIKKGGTKDLKFDLKSK